MSIYKFAPCPDKSTQEQTFATWENGFSDEEIKNIINIGDKFLKTNSAVGPTNTEDGISHIRKSELHWISHNQETDWIYDKFAHIARYLNGQFFDFDLFGFVEDFQYTVYRPEGDHYTWHMDKGSFHGSPRKLSLVLQLSDPSEYDGGDLEFFYSPDTVKAKKEKGLVYAFPSWIMHRVTPVTRGVRRTMVVWVSGPKFR